MQGSNPGKKWSLNEAENTVKAVFLLATQSEEPQKLRYTDIKKSIESTGRVIHPKILVEAIKSLVQKGQMTCEDSELDRRTRLYSLVPLGHEQTLELMATVDVARIEAGRKTGAVADLTENWSYYGIPPVLRSRFRPRLRAEAKAFKRRIEDAFEDEVKEFLADLRRRAKGRLNNKRVEEGIVPCDLVLLGSKELGKMQSLYLFTERLIQEYMSGSRPFLEVEAISKSLIERKYAEPDRALLKKIYGLTDDELDDSIKLAEDARKRIRLLFDSLAREDRERLAERMLSLMILRNSLCAVVHF